MKRIYVLLLMLFCALPALAVVDISGLPDEISDTFDLTWEMAVSKVPSAPLLIDVSAGKSVRYQLRIDAARASWQQPGGKTPTILAGAPLSLKNNTTYTFSLKRRPDTIALLLNHRLLLCAPAPSAAETMMAFRQLPAGMTIREARYHAIEPHFFGDDFMRPEAPRPTLGRLWVEDPTWEVGYYRKDRPGSDPLDPKTGETMVNPWQLSLFQVVESSTNGFWYLYTGVGPSWAIANPTMVAPTWDRYFVEAAVRTEYDGAVGLIAAYQDNKNYLLFRWRPRGYVAQQKSCAELIAVVDGKERVLATSPRGYDPGQWYTLRLNLSWQRVEALVDGQLLLAANNSGPVEGRIGLYADGAANPRKPKLDSVTATMYLVTDENTGKVINDAADAMRTTSTIYFDDIRAGDWVGVDDLLSSPYPKEQIGSWINEQGILRAKTAGRLVTGSAAWERYVATTRVRIPANGSAGLFVHLNDAQTGYAWMISAQQQQLQPLAQGKWQPAIARASVNLKSGVWADLRVEADGPYLALFCNGTRVLEAYDPTRSAGRCGILATSAGVQFDSFRISPMERHQRTVDIHQGFDNDAWMASWSRPEADWYPEVNHGNYLILPAASGKRADPGPAAPLATNIPGLYWQKGGYYHDLRVTIPVSPATLDGQTLHLSANYQAAAGYRVQLTQQDGKGLATLLRGETTIGKYPFPLTERSRLVFERRGGYLLLFALALDPQDTSDDPEVIQDWLLTAYRDAKPLHADMIGFTVTKPELSAAMLAVESDRYQDTFEQSPVRWTAQSGVWAVMARYSCQPKWNWYGGFGAGTPTVWNKLRLDGDQNVEVYMGIKMQYDNMPERENQRFRDMNVTICADGARLNSGYTVIRSGRQGGQPVTLLLRKGIVVKMSSDPADLLPSGATGHRMWFATRIEKRGGEIKVFLDNRLAMTYVDPDPLPGGYTAFWTLNNGIMIGRANLSAEHMSIGTPQAAAPVVQEELAPREAPTATIDGKAVKIATFEAGLDGWQPRPGISGVLLRERVTGRDGKPNTYLKVVNAYPAGDLSATLSNTPVNLADTPVLTFEYSFDPGAQVNLYLRHQDTWYEVLLTGEEAAENVRTAGTLKVVADGSWHRLQADIGGMLAAAITRSGGDAADLSVQEVLIADWTTAPDLRNYGFGRNPGGTAISFDNVGFIPRTDSPLLIK